MSMLMTAQPAAVQRDPRRWAGLAVLCASLLVVAMDMTILNVALPSLAADLRPSSVQLLWIVDVYSLVLAGLLVTAASLGDRWGRRNVLLAGFAVFGAASMLILFASSPLEVIAVRALLGIGGAMIMPTTLSMIRTLFVDPRERATALGIWAAMAALGSALGPIVGGALLEAFSWHSAFLVNVPLMALALGAGLVLLPEGRTSTGSTLDLRGTALSIVGMAALLFAIKTLAKDGLTPLAIGCAVLAVAALTAFVRRCLRQERPMLDVRLFARPSFTAGVLTALSSSTALAAVLLLGAQWLQLVEGYSPLHAGAALLPAALLGVLASPLAPSLAYRIGARPVLVGGLAIGGAGFLVLFAVPGELTYPTLSVSLALIGLSTGALAVASAVIMAGAPADKSGSAAAIEETSYEVGAALGVAVLGSLAAAIYRGGVGSLDGLGLSADQIKAAEESLAGALDAAGTLGEAGSALAAQASSAFTSGLMWVGLIGAVLMLSTALAVRLLAPRQIDITGTHH